MSSKYEQDTEERKGRKGGEGKRKGREWKKGNQMLEFILLVNPNLKFRGSFENLIHNASNYRILEEIQNFEENTAGKQY